MKLRTIAAAALFAAMGASAQAYTFNGDTTGGPTYNRPFTLLSLSGVGTAVHYAAFTFSVDMSGAYTFNATTAEFDPFIALYSPSFDPTAGLTNLLALNDDFAGSFSESQFTTALSAGTAYVLINTGYGNADFGAFTTTITGPGNVVAVPEPATWGLMALGMLGVGAAAARRRKQALAA